MLIDDVTVAFGSLRAVDGLTLRIEYGAVRAIIGPNGAGKTTLLDVITGKTRATSGRVVLDRTTDLTRLGEAAISLAGVGRKFQKPSVFEALTLRQNLALALRSPARGALAEMLHRPGRDELDRIERVLEIIGMAGSGEKLAGILSHGQKQWLEIGMLLMREPRVLLLDEPVAGMSDEETSRTVELVLALRAPDRAVVVIEHDMDFVERIADLVTVLDQGRLLVEGGMSAVKSDPRVVDVYLGR
ncbi:urea ABC transporter ATP-binding protein [Skermanella stibiiresistens SB22]|uniref:Urea ABC transporter ATP-binding protein n=1 Tax=Skermanella stibiiresistens SB22 TaxID=1385369 RepID=W9H5X7_9PROT|nr:urea ABC transporter ATP-binding protein [Skermanella stibiiresistens SB22]